MKGSFEPFGRLTDIYVKLRYGNERLTNEEIEEFYTNLLKTIDWLKNCPQGEK